MKFKALSLFANIGVAEAYLKDIGIDIKIANELVKRRANLYQAIYPETEMICGDITDLIIYNKILDKSLKAEIDIIMATPPCQGMSTAGQQLKDDKRNSLILPVLNLVKEIKPKYVFLENVPLILQTKIIFKRKETLITDVIKEVLGNDYNIRFSVIDTKDYEVPQTRERAIMLLSSKKEKNIWEIPKKSNKIVTMKDAIGELPELDPFIKDVSAEELLSIFPDYEKKKLKALKISKWNNPPHHIKRQVKVMMHTPTGCSAFSNPIYKPIKEDGTQVRGYFNTYKRQNWDTPAYTVTMDNRKISSQNNVHPGRFIKKDKKGNAIYSDPRALTVYELFLISSIPTNWPIPDNTQEAFLRSVIGEGIPPLFVKKVFENLQVDKCKI